jgi:hypothetical protein
MSYERMEDVATDLCVVCWCEASERYSDEEYAARINVAARYKR